MRISIKFTEEVRLSAEDIRSERKVIFDTDLHKLSDQIHKLTEAIDHISLENRKLNKWTGYHKKCEHQVRGKHHKFRKKIRQKGSSIAEGIM